MSELLSLWLTYGKATTASYRNALNVAAFRPQSPIAINRSLFLKLRREDEPVKRSLSLLAVGRFERLIIQTTRTKKPSGKYPIPNSTPSKRTTKGDKWKETANWSQIEKKRERCEIVFALIARFGGSIRDDRTKIFCRFFKNGA